MRLETDSTAAIGPANSSGRKGRVLIVGLGNMLLKDDGVGVHVAKRLEEMALPCSVEVIDGGTAGLDVLLLHEDVDKLVVIDAMRTGKKPGTIYKGRFKAGESEELAWIFGQSAKSKISLHQVGLIDALAAAEKMNRAPKEIVIIGVEPGQWDYGLELTETVKQSIPEVIKKVLEETENAVHRE
jgi:hydrogenase maturation protease